MSKLTSKAAAQLACDRVIRAANVLRTRIETSPPGAMQYYVDDLVRDLEDARSVVASYTAGINDDMREAGS